MHYDYVFVDQYPDERESRRGLHKLRGSSRFRGNEAHQPSRSSRPPVPPGSSASSIHSVAQSALSTGCKASYNLATLSPLSRFYPRESLLSASSQARRPTKLPLALFALIVYLLASCPSHILLLYILLAQMLYLSSPYTTLRPPNIRLTAANVPIVMTSFLVRPLTSPVGERRTAFSPSSLPPCLPLLFGPPCQLKPPPSFVWSVVADSLAATVYNKRASKQQVQAFALPADSDRREPSTAQTLRRRLRDLPSGMTTQKEQTWKENGKLEARAQALTADPRTRLTELTRPSSPSPPVSHLRPPFNLFPSAQARLWPTQSSSRVFSV